MMGIELANSWSMLELLQLIANGDIMGSLRGIYICAYIIRKVGNSWDNCHHER